MSCGRLDKVSMFHRKNGIERLTMVTQENNGGSNAVLFCNLVDNLVSEQRRASATKRAVRRDVNALFLAEVVNLLLWAQWVVLNLVDGWDNGGFGEELLQIPDGVVGDTNGLDLFRMCLDEFFHVLPCVLVGH